MSIADNIRRFRQQLPRGVELVAVSKFHPISSIQQAYDAGQRVFGESRVQELSSKRTALPSDIQWHFIGHLQTNKAKQLVGNVDLIESVDSERLLNLIDRLSTEKGVVSRVLMQIHVAAEETKTGFSPEELLEYFKSHRHNKLKATVICGIMGMATNTDDKTRIRADFDAIAGIYHEIKKICQELDQFNTISMGMSGDFEDAIAAGSTSIRIGSAIFGDRI